jgi:hypothetical protein
MTAKQPKVCPSRQMNLVLDQRTRPSAPRHLILTKSRVVTTEAFDTYWHFAAERQRIFFRKAAGSQPPWTTDPILLRYRFTNAYRAADRVSQFLIRRVQAQGPQDPCALFFRTVLFKLFNRTETWVLLESKCGLLSPETYVVGSYEHVLSDAMALGRRVYSAAYIMPSGGVEGQPKHKAHLKLLETMIKDNLPNRIAESGSMRQAFDLLRAYPMIGDFLAYQYVTDLNYSDLLTFSEMDFVMPGPGARSGIRKCFADYGSYSESDLIRWMADHQEEEFARRGIDFSSLWGRPLQLIDCQNLFCEVDKYARVYHPEIAGLTGRVRIKQEYRLNSEPVDYWFPPKWRLNENVAAWYASQNRITRSA